jgi:uncharacterized membrane protein
VRGFSIIDYAALGFFVVSWIAYYVAVERTAVGRQTLNILMNDYRHRWMEQMVSRDNRIVDTTIMASLQNGSAFFASTSLIAIGGSLTLLRSAEDAVSVFNELPLGLVTTRFAWEVKVVGLAIIFVYAFFKFAWAYRIFNYAAILVGAVPVLPHEHGADAREAALAAARKAAAMTTVAGMHFNRGQRAFFFALAYLGWFVSPYVLIAATAAVLYVMWQRQFASAARAAVLPSD